MPLRPLSARCAAAMRRSAGRSQERRRVCVERSNCYGRPPGDARAGLPSLGQIRLLKNGPARRGLACAFAASQSRRLSSARPFALDFDPLNLFLLLSPALVFHDTPLVCPPSPRRLSFPLRTSLRPPSAAAACSPASPRLPPYSRSGAPGPVSPRRATTHSPAPSPQMQP